MATGKTKHSDKIDGNEKNYGLWTRLDLTDGYLGITQGVDGSAHVEARALLTPHQVNQLKTFVGVKPKGRTPTKRNAKAK